MKRLIALFLAGLTITSHAQSVDDYQPDSDGDGCIGMSDLLSLLSVFGSCEAQSFACGDPINYQGYDYATVLIGEQCWFAENLRSENYENGDAIPTNLSGNEWEDTTIGAVSVYGQNSDCENFASGIDPCDPNQSLPAFGRLYNWYAVDDSRGICPTGWHVPSDEEWMTLEMSLGMIEEEVGESGYRGYDQAIQMRTDYYWYWGGYVGTNSSGFTGLPAGGRNEAGLDYLAGRYGFFWSASTSQTNAWYRGLYSNNHGVARNHCDKGRGYSVRCVQGS